MDATPIVQRFLSPDDLDGLALAIATPYQACTDFMRLNVVTSSFPIGMEQRPHLLRAFVDHSLMRFANSRPGFHHELKWNAAHNCLHVRIFKGKCALTAHFMGRKDFRDSVRHAVNREPLAMRNDGDLFADEASELDARKDGAYVQILHGGNAAVQYLELAIPTRNQMNLGAWMPLAIPTADAVKAEQIREELSLKVKDIGGLEAVRDGNEAAS